MITNPFPHSAKELLNEAVDQMKSRRFAMNEVAQPFDCGGMDIITSADCPDPLLMVVGKEYEQWVLKHAYYFAATRRLRTAFVCFGAKPLHYLLGLLALSSGISERDLNAFRVSPHFFGAFNKGCEELYGTDLAFYEGMDFEDFPRFAKGMKDDGVEVLVVDALDPITIGGKPTTRIRRQCI